MYWQLRNNPVLALYIALMPRRTFKIRFWTRQSSQAVFKHLANKKEIETQYLFLMILSDAKMA